MIVLFNFLFYLPEQTIETFTSTYTHFDSHYFDNGNISATQSTYINADAHRDIEHNLAASICQGASDCAQGKCAIRHGFLPSPRLQDQDQIVKRGVDGQDSSDSLMPCRETTYIQLHTAAK